MPSESLQQFIESTPGQIIVFLVILLLFTGILLSGKRKKTNTKVLVVSAVLVALSIALNQVVLFRMPQGGSITAFSMLPVIVCAYLFGLRRGMMAGMCVGFLDLIFNPYIIHPLQMILDYPLAFGALGFAALVRNQKFGLQIGLFIGVLGRYLCATLSGIVFFGEYVPEGFPVVLWSLYYNLTYLGIEGLLALIVISLPAVKQMLSQMKFQLE